MDVIVHGGAGGTPQEPTERLAVLESAAEAASQAPTPVAAVIRAIEPLESSPRFNAGRGGAVQIDGEIRTDAGIMRADRSVGAAASMPGVEHAIQVAEAVRTETPHVQLAGERAVEFAREIGVDTDRDLWTDRSRERWADAHIDVSTTADQLAAVQARFGDGSDTVGAVATDGSTVAAGTSTGGRWFALAGRVGDVPQVGSGFYATPAGGASTTGAGEDIARVTLARTAVAALEDGLGAQIAAETALEDFQRHTEGVAGLIVLTPTGDLGSAFCSDGMQTAAARNGHLRDHSSQ